MESHAVAGRLGRVGAGAFAGVFARASLMAMVGTLALAGCVSSSERPGDGPRTITGMYVYMADAAAIETCESGHMFPVVIDAGHLPLERAYLDARQSPGDALFVEIRGSFVEREPEPGMEPRTFIEVDSFEGFSPGQDCD